MSEIPRARIPQSVPVCQCRVPDRFDANFGKRHSYQHALKVQKYETNDMIA